MSVVLFSLMVAAATASHHSVMASPPDNARTVLASADMPFALLNGSTCGSWACTHFKSFDQHFETKYPPGFSTSFEAYYASPTFPELTETTEVEFHSVLGALTPRAPDFAKRITQDSFALHFGDLDPVGSDPLFDVYYTFPTSTWRLTILPCSSFTPFW